MRSGIHRTGWRTFSMGSEWICQFSTVTGKRGESGASVHRNATTAAVVDFKAAKLWRRWGQTAPPASWGPSYTTQHLQKVSQGGGGGAWIWILCGISVCMECSRGLTSSTRPKPPTPSVAMTSSWSKGLDEGNAATNSFKRMTSGDSGWLWWRDTDLFLHNDDNTNQAEC